MQLCIQPAEAPRLVNHPAHQAPMASKRMDSHSLAMRAVKYARWLASTLASLGVAGEGEAMRCWEGARSASRDGHLAACCPALAKKTVWCQNKQFGAHSRGQWCPTNCPGRSPAAAPTPPSHLVSAKYSAMR